MELALRARDNHSPPNRNAAPLSPHTLPNEIAVDAATDEVWMRRALAQAERARDVFGEVPVGAVLVDAQGQLVAEGCNRTITDCDPSAHAEIVALRAAGRALGNYRLNGCTLYVTLEPCAMCAMALVHARIARVVYAADDPKTGAVHSVFQLLQSEHHNHRVAVQGGVMADDCGALLRDFFRARRGRPRTENQGACE